MLLTRAVDRRTHDLTGIVDAVEDRTLRAGDINPCEGPVVEEEPMPAGFIEQESYNLAGIIDAVEHRQDFEKMLQDKYGKNVVFERKYGKKKTPKMDFSSPFAMFKIMGDLLGDGKKKDSKKASVAIVYVDGGIDIGSGKISAFGTTGASVVEIRKALYEAANDDSIKAVVLRVDSPGGSAVASEIPSAAPTQAAGQTPEQRGRHLLDEMLLGRPLRLVLGDKRFE